MPRKYTGTNSTEYEPPRKKSSNNCSNNLTQNLKEGEIICDIAGKKWRLGKPVGIGGFGEIYLVSDDLHKDVRDNTQYVAKIEKHTNGPLFVEVNCYLRLGKLSAIEEWQQQHKLDFLGMPHYVASGSLTHKGDKYRFLILPKFDEDLEAVFQSKKLFNLKTVLVIAIQILDVLEYIHSHGYVHSDIKASNILLGQLGSSSKSVVKNTSVIETKRTIKNPSRFGFKTHNIVPRPVKTTKTTRSLRNKSPVSYVDDIPYLEDILKKHEKYKYFSSPKKVSANLKANTTEDKVALNSNINTGDKLFLLDYGLATKYVLSNGDHREFCTDARRAHAGTVLFCSRDAHEGTPSRRSDLESLAYNMVYWLTGSLPWIDDVSDPELVEKKKKKCFNNLNVFLDICFPEKRPAWLLKFFEYLQKLEFEQTPDYDFCRNLFKNAIKKYGYKNDSKLDFDNLEVSDKKHKKILKNGENRKKALKRSILLTNNTRIPLHSNIIFKRPKLRKKLKDKYAKCSMMNWSRILIMDPETVIRQARVRKTTEGSDPGSSITSMDLASLNPTPMMFEVYSRCVEREEGGSPSYKGDEATVTESIEGYTPEMVRMHTLMRTRRELEFAEATRNANSFKRQSRKSNSRNGSSRKRRSSSKAVTTKVTKSLIDMPQTKKETPLKKVKSGSLKRVYSLRG